MTVLGDSVLTGGWAMTLLHDSDLDGRTKPGLRIGRVLRFDLRTYRRDRLLVSLSNGNFAVAVALILIGVPKAIVTPVFLCGQVLALVAAAVAAALRGPYRCP